jgi:hypothetical protein
VEEILTCQLASISSLRSSASYHKPPLQKVNSYSGSKPRDTYESKRLKSVYRRHKKDLASLCRAVIVYTVTESNIKVPVTSTEYDISTRSMAHRLNGGRSELTNMQILGVISWCIR